MTSLPEYERPPVQEVLLGINFKARLGGPYIGLLWQEFRSRFGNVQEQAPLALRLERFGLPEPPEPQFELLDTVPPRMWFINDMGTELIQVQQDWFSHNWRKLKEADEYPRYAQLRASFHDEMKALVAFLEREKLGALEPVQCEITYVNHIPLQVGERLEDILSVFTSSFSDDFLKEPENAGLSLRFVISEADKPIGRLHIAANPVFLIKTGGPGVQLTLTVRGKPAGDDLDSIFAFWDKGHEWIVRGFASVTTTKMHEKWRRTQ